LLDPLPHDRVAIHAGVGDHALSIPFSARSEGIDRNGYQVMNPEETDPERIDDGSRRPRDLALLLLAIGGGPPRQRARDQQADLAGVELLRKILDRLAALDPEPDDFESALARIAAEFGEPSGPTRGLCLGIKREWEECRVSPAAWSWLLSEAIQAAEGVPKRRRGRGTQSLP
jgi:hypothetical protein